MSPAEAAGASILVVEDNPVNQMLVRQQLERLGHVPTIVGTATEGLDALHDGHAFDLVLMDWQLPDIDGLEATRRLRTAEATSGRHVPVVAMTASAMPEDRAACLDAGMDDFMAKPVGLEELGAMVDKWAASGSSATGATGPLAEGEPHVQALAALHRDLDDLDLVVGLVGRFLDELGERRVRFHEAVDAGDLESLGRVGHTLKSTSDMMGVTSLREVCAEAEHADANADLHDLGRRFDQAADDAEVALRSWVASQSNGS